jgi:DNA-binding NarL/FixJ family response regulator
MAQTFANRRALVVDDEFLIAFDMEESMRELGFEVCSVAPNVEKAIRLAVTNQPEVVLMDVYLGGAHEGIEAGRWLREVCGASVVFVTAHNDDGTLERIREAVPGAPILSKPVYREQLAKAISEAIH